MLQRVLLSFLFIGLAVKGYGQNGSILGTVTDAVTNEAIVGANVVIQDTQVGSPTDLDGNFTISNVKPGTYNLVVSFITYKTHVIPEVIVEGGKKTAIQIALKEDATELKEIVVSGTREINSDLSLISAIRDSKLVVSGISAEQIIKTPDKDAAQIMQRVPGVTIVDNRFVMVRGVPERYNQVMINNAIAPNTEIDKRSFSFDLIPSGAIDQLLIFKSGSADLPGDFAGGVIQLMTRQATEEEFTSVGFNLGYRHNTSLRDFSYTKGSATDFLGFDNGFRALPDNFPSSDVLRNTGPTSQVRENAGKLLTNNFDIQTKSAPVDYGFSLGLSRNMNLGRVHANNLTTLGYSNGFQSYRADFIRYNLNSKDPNVPSVERFRYIDNYFTNETKINLVHNWVFSLNDRHTIEFKNLFVQIGENQTILREGEDFIQRLDQELRNNAYHYLSRTIYSGQLQGTLNVSEGVNKLTWLLGHNSITRDEPDYRRFRRYKNTATEEPLEMILPPSANLFDAGRFYSDLTEKCFDHAVNFEHKFADIESKRTPTIKAGYYTQYKTREYDARYVSYLYPGFFDQEEGQRLAKLPLNEIFSPENVNSSNGFVIQEGTRPTDYYKGTNFLMAGYISGNIPLGKLDVAGGIRVEYNLQQLDTKDDAGSVSVNNPITSPLPFLNVAYNITDRSLVRLAYSRTVNRPEFRELAPFLYYMFNYDAVVFGNSELKTATINNIDLRWEMYPNPGELISVGTFYKSFTNPIEFYQYIVTENQQFSYGNAPVAYSLGAEVEMRKSLASLAISRFFRNMSVNLNASLIKSEVDLGSEITSQRQKRNLQGQSPYVVNAGLYYSDADNGFSVNASYNIIGKRIFSVGNAVFPTWWEMPRHVLDLQIAKRFGRMEVKCNIQNLLNAKYRMYQDNDDDQKIDTSVDEPVQGYRTGALYSLSFGWKFSKK